MMQQRYKAPSTMMRFHHVIVALLFVLPIASPFASGSSGGPLPSTYANHRHSPVSSTTPLAPDPSPPLPSQMSAPLMASSTPSSSTVEHVTDETMLGKILRRILGRRLFRCTTDVPNNWRGGEDAASCLSRLLFRYATPITRMAGQRRLDVDDAFAVVDDRRKMATQAPALQQIYHDLQHEQRYQLAQAAADGTATRQQSWLLTRALLQHQQSVLIVTGLLRLTNTLVQAFPALLVSRLLRLIEAGEAYPASRAIWAAMTLVAVLSVKMIIENQYFHNVVKCSTTVRGSLTALIFDKSLKLPNGGSGVSYQDSKDEKSARSKTLGAGGVMNLMQSDAGIIESAAVQLHTIWDGPLQIAMYSYLLFCYLGRSVLWGMAVLLMTIPINSVTLRVLNRLARFENEAKDARTKRTAESIFNMKLLKLQAWENRFAEDVREHRREELRRHVTRGVVRALNTAVSNAVPALVLVVTLTAYAKTGRPIVASTIFTAISLFNQLRFPLFFYPMLIDSLANGRNAMQRISTFLSAEEMVSYVTHKPIGRDGGGKIVLHNGNFLWNVSPARSNASNSIGTSSAIPALSNAELLVGPGEIVAVVGSVGSGKTALVKALLGELNPVPPTVVHSALSGEDGDDKEWENTSGIHDVLARPSVEIVGNVGFCSQEAWLPKGTLRDAVVFGRAYDEKQYLAAIHDAGLDNDIVENPADANSSEGLLSHETDVGEGGSSLSGGQRARVALARALYAADDTKVFLLDDCLAALDASVGAMVFERLTRRLRNADAAAVIVTNDPNIPRRCDRVVLMGNVPGSSSCSTIVDVGSYDELIGRGHKLRSHESTGKKEYANDSFHNGTEELAADQPELMKIRRNAIRIVGGYEVPVNTTECTEESCHAEPDAQVALENYPDYMGEKRVPVSPELRDEDDMLSYQHGDKRDTVNGDTSRFNVPAPSITDDSALSDKRNTAQSQILPSMPKKLSSADDVMSAGAVPLSTYVSYFRAVGSPLLVVGMVGAYLMANGAQFYQQYTVAKWTEVSSSSIATAIAGRYLKSLVNAAGVVSVFLWFRSFLTMQVGVRASELLHSRMLASVFKAPMSFFDATPSGQLLARFGKEMETVDRGVPDSIGSVLFCFLQIFLSIGALVGIVTPAILIPMVAVGALYVRTMGLFRPAARDMKRAETKSRSPIYTHFGEALRGCESIRSIPGAVGLWSRRHKSLSDKNLAVFYTVKALDRWLSIRLEGLGNIVVLTCAIASVILTRAGSLKAGSAGWGLTQALAITGLLNWAVRCLTDLETSMMSVMRVKELTDIDSEEADLGDLKHLTETAKRRPMPREPAIPGEALRPLLPLASGVSSRLAPRDSGALVASGWPWRGNISFKNVSMRYNPAAPLVLQNISLSIPAGTTLGVVGRTGSGKSSLLLTLFRLAEIEPGGSIEIDGVDVRSVGLQVLRQSLAIIPQDPVLFAGTLLFNLDATGKASENQMWAALEAASPSLALQFRNADGMQTYISEGGKNLSLGQRQLICLARALLRRSRILVLDEATSSVDPRTDQEVQETIRREFVDKGVTVMTVAHRLETVLGYDKICVLGNGRVEEYGEPADLLKIPGGELRRLVDADRRNKRKGASVEPSSPESFVTSPQ